MSDGSFAAGQLPWLEDLGDLLGKKVLVRVDFNVPMQADMILDDLRIRAAIPTLLYLREQGADVVACSHLGRPKGRVVPELSLAPVRKRLNELLPGIELLENLRFDRREDDGDLSLTKELIDGCDAFVNDAFAVCHRPTASIVGPPEFLPSAAGRLVMTELMALGNLIESPLTPYVAVLGGVKVSDKIGVVRSLLQQCDRVLIGGAMCLTFLAAKGHNMADSLVQTEYIDECKQLLAMTDKIVLPSDLIIENADGRPDVCGLDLPSGSKGYDIGPESTLRFSKLIKAANTVFWNGPMGMFEDDRFASGTLGVAMALSQCDGYTVVGGGESASAIAKYGLADSISHVATGGGASLEYLEYGDLPGLKALRGAVNVKQ